MNRMSNLEKKYVLDVLDNNFDTSKNSIYINKVEKLFTEIFNIKYAISHCNGTATLHTALNSLGITKRDEVIVPPLTMSSTAISVLLNGSTPIFADVDLKTFNIDPKSIESLITPKTKAIMTVALYGLSPDYDEILKICKKYNLFLIEDNAETFLSEYKGNLVGTFGDFSSFSFQASKHLTCGEGGMLITNNFDYANKARQFNSLGYSGVSASKSKISKEDIQNPNYDRHVSLGYNYRMSEIQAAVLCGQLERSEELVNQRIKVSKIFDKAIENSKILYRQDEPIGYKNTWWSYSMVLENVDWFDFRKEFKKNGGDDYYASWKLSYMEPLFQNMINKHQKYEKGLCPNAEYLQSKMIQMKTNYWNLDEAKIQSDILYNTIKKFE